MATMARMNLKPQEHAALLYREGVKLLQAGKFDDGITRLKKALKAASDSPALLKDLGMVYLERQEWDAAEQWIDRAIRLDPLWPNALYNKCRILIGREKYAEAEPVLRCVRRAKFWSKTALTVMFCRILISRTPKMPAPVFLRFWILAATINPALLSWIKCR